MTTDLMLLAIQNISMALHVGHCLPIRRIAFQFLRLCHDVWRKDHGYFTFAEVLCPAWFEGDEDTSSGGVHTCNLIPEVWRTSQ
jgi:hypothetical protein